MSSLMQAVNLPDLVEKLYNKAKRDIRVYPCHANRASMIDHDCERCLTYWRTSWDQVAAHEVDLELIFREGRIQEEAVLRSLMDAGIEVLEQQRPLSWREYQVTGHIDGVLRVDGKAVLLEIKSMADQIWRSVAREGPKVYDWEQVASAFTTKPWLRKYYGQLQVYMLCKECEAAILLCKNKSTGAIAQINVTLDYGYAEKLIQRAERINAHVAAGTLPERIAWDDEVCGRCEFLHLCLPDRVNKNPIQFVEDEQAEKRLETRYEAEEASREFKAADEWVKAWVWEKYPDEATVTIGTSWVIEKSLTRNGRKQTKIKRLA